MSLNVGENNITEEIYIAESMNEYFTNIGPNLAAQVSTTNIKPESYVDRTESTFSFTLIDVHEVYEALNNLKTSKSLGPDKIPARLLKGSYLSTAPYLTKIFNASLTSSNSSQEWKLARVSPIHKAGGKRESGNYRPISVLPIVAKLFEKIIY